MRVLNINVSIFIDIIALYFSLKAALTKVYGLMVIGNRRFRYSACEFCYDFVSRS